MLCNKELLTFDRHTRFRGWLKLALENSIQLLRRVVWYSLHSLFGRIRASQPMKLAQVEEAGIQGREPVQQGILDSHIKMRENSRYVEWSGWESCRRVLGEWDQNNSVCHILV